MPSSQLVSVRSLVTWVAAPILASIVASVMAGVALADGADTETAPLTLSLDEAQERAERRAPQVHLGEARIREARASGVGAGVRLPSNPRVSFDVRPGLRGDARGEVGHAGALDITLDVSGAPGARVREAEARTRVAAAEQALNRLEARLEALSWYAEIRTAGLRQENSQKAIALGERVLAAARERAAAGAGSDVETASAEAELAERRSELQAATAAQITALTQLRLLLGLPAQRPLRLTTAIETPEAAPPLPQMISAAHSRRPDLAAAAARIALLDVQASRLRQEAWPKVGVQAGIDASPASPLFGILGLAIELPFAQRNQGPRAVAAAERQTELDRVALIHDRIATALHGARQVYEARRAQLEALTRDGIPAATRRLALVETGWRAGRFDIFRLTSAAQDLVRVESTRVQVLEEIWRQRITLERLQGGYADDR
jgi:outer membrane protein TolC